jgi:predicted DNA-binding ribbon-helix-helix protein
MSEYIRKSIFIDSRRTSISLESSIWSALEEICERENVTLSQICTLIDAELTSDVSRTSAVRAFIVNYFRTMTNNSKLLKNGSLKPIGKNIKLLAHGPIGLK